jgi:hypothetical protein
MNFDKLTGVDTMLSISSNDESIMTAEDYIVAGGLSPSGSRYPTMDISFPSLTNTTCLKVWGNVSRLVHSPVDGWMES